MCVLDVAKAKAGIGDQTGVFEKWQEGQRGQEGPVFPAPRWPLVPP